MSLDFKDNRYRSSVHIDIGSVSIVIDTGPDFRAQMLRERVRKLDAILFTHAHKDHTAGMDDIRSFNFRQKSDMPIFARKSVIKQIKTEFSYVFASDKYPGVPQIEPHEIENNPFKIKQVEIMPIEVMHHKLPVFGFRIRDFTYITDAKSISEPEKEKIKGFKK